MKYICIWTQYYHFIICVTSNFINVGKDRVQSQRHFLNNKKFRKKPVWCCTEMILTVLVLVAA